MHRLILLMCFVLSLLPLAIVTGCGTGSRKPPGLGNTPIELPQHAGYALAYIEGCIAVVDLDRNEVVGIHRVARESEFLEDFEVDSDGTLFVCISRKMTLLGPRTSRIIRVLDSGTGEVITEIEVSRGPRRISRIPGDLAIVEHAFLPYGSSEYACSVIDMNRMSVDRTLYFKGLAGEVLLSPEGRYFIGIGDVMQVYGGYTLVEFDPQTRDTVGPPITLKTDFMFETAVFATASKIYAPTMYPVEDPSTSTRVRPLAVLEFPSGRLLDTITPVPFDVLHMVRVGQKVYVASFLGSTWKGALEVGKGVVSVIDVNTDQVIKTLDVSPGPEHMAYSESTGKLYVACVDGRISVIDTSTDEVVGTIVCDDPRASGWGFNRVKVAS